MGNLSKAPFPRSSQSLIGCFLAVCHVVPNVAKKGNLMAPYNSLVEFYSALFIELLHDIAEKHCVSSSIISRDVAFIERRIGAEGLQFLTVTLPSLGKAVDTALSTDTPLTFVGFRKDPTSSQPLFLQWLFSGVFACDTLLEREDSNPMCLKSLRQLLYFVYKLSLPFPDKLVKQTLDKFVETDSSLPTLPSKEDAETLDDQQTQLVLTLARTLITRVCGDLDHRDIQPGHGPGAVATREDPVEKSYFNTIYSELDAIYPYSEYFVSGSMHICDCYQEIQGHTLKPSGQARIVLVPKDSRGPRIISCEPLSYQWIQQGLKKVLMGRIEEHPLTSGHVNFTDQSINRRLAMQASMDGYMVTLDMKDASDRVSLELVSYLFSGCPFLEGLLASRSDSTRLPDGTVIKLKKFAPMGSALCFPVESLVFWALTVATIRVTRKSHQGFSSSLNWALNRTYVYGDDIIVPKSVYQSVLRMLPRVGLMFNESKCAYGRAFRESCGCDAYKGVDVTPVKIKTVWSSSLKNSPRTLCSYIALSNALYSHGYYRVASFIQKAVELTFGLLPYSESSAVPFLCWVRPDVCAQAINRSRGFRYRFNRYLHRLEMNCLSITPVILRDKKCDTWSLLLRRIFSFSEHTNPGEYAAPRRIRLIRGWNPVNPCKGVSWEYELY